MFSDSLINVEQQTVNSDWQW